MGGTGRASDEQRLELDPVGSGRPVGRISAGHFDDPVEYAWSHGRVMGQGDTAGLLAEPVQHLGVVVPGGAEGAQPATIGSAGSSESDRPSRIAVVSPVGPGPITTTLAVVLPLCSIDGTRSRHVPDSEDGPSQFRRPRSVRARTGRSSSLEQARAELAPTRCRRCADRTRWWRRS
jgi:hypothetical protein